MFLGFFLLILGVVIILSRADIIPGGVWDYILPIILIAIGGGMIVKRSRKSS